MEIWTDEGLLQAVMCFSRHMNVCKSALELPSKAASYESDLELDMHSVFDDIHIKAALLFYSYRFINLEFVWSNKERTVFCCNTHT